MDSKNNWGMEPADAVNETLAQQDMYLRKHTIDDYVETLLTNFEGFAYRAGKSSQYCNVEGLRERLYEILQHSPYAQMEPKIIELADKTSITLPDGSVMPINQHLLKK